MDENCLEEFKCPICFEIPQKEIYQCERGHTVCDQCSLTLTACPQCRIKYEGRRIRNRALESLLDKNRFDCAFKLKGCDERITRQNIREHEETCSFGTTGTKFCEQLGYSCDYLLNSNNISESLAHLQASHGFIICHHQKVNICMEGISNVNPNIKSFWTPIAFDLLKTSGFAWILLNLFNDETKTISSICMKIVEDDLQGNTKALFVIQPNDTTKMPDVLWGSTLADIKLTSEMVEYPPHGLNWKTLTINYINDDTLHIVCSVKKNFSDVTNVEDVPTLYTFNNLFIDPRSQSLMAPSAPESELGSLELKDSVERLGYRMANHSLEHSVTRHLEIPFRTPVENVIFNGIFCDVCKNTPVAERYKCLQCADFDLCGACMRRNEHKEHEFALISTMKQEMFLQRSFRKPNGWKPFLDQTRLTRKPSLDLPSLRCFHCTNAANSKYICLFCWPLYGCCDACFSEFFPSHKDDRHFFAIVNSHRSMQLILWMLHTYRK